MPFTPKIRLILNCTALMLIIAALGYRITGDAAHEYIGFSTCIALFLHNLANLRWYCSIFKGRYNIRRFTRAALNISLACAGITLLCAAAVSSRSLFNLGFDGGILARQIHATAAYWLFALAALHMGIHLPKRIFCPSTPTAKFLLSIIILAIYALGIYAWEERSMGEKLFSGYTFDFWNDSVPAIYFFAYNLSIFLCLAISAAIADKSFNKILNNSAKNHNHKP